MAGEYVVDFFIPWQCLGEETSKKALEGKGKEVEVALEKPTTTKKTFAQVLKVTCDVSVNQLPMPCVKEDIVTAQIDEEDYLQGLEECKNHVYRRIILARGDKAQTHLELCLKLKVLWKDLGDWKAIPIGKGFYEFSFHSLDEMRRALTIGVWNLAPGVLRLFVWSKDFIPSTVKLTKTQCWVKLRGLPMEYWKPRTLFSITRGIGTPLSLDECTLQKSRGFFARILVDVNLQYDLPNQIMVERKGFALVVELKYEKLPEFCSLCRAIGHSMSVCKHNIIGEKGKKKSLGNNSKKKILFKGVNNEGEKDSKHEHTVEIEDASKQQIHDSSTLMDKDKENSQPHGL